MSDKWYHNPFTMFEIILGFCLIFGVVIMVAYWITDINLEKEQEEMCKQTCGDKYFFSYNHGKGASTCTCSTTSEVKTVEIK